MSWNTTCQGRYDRLIDQQTLTDYKVRHQRRYTWGVGNRLQQTDDSKFGKTCYNYDLVGQMEQVGRERIVNWVQAASLR